MNAYRVFAISMMKDEISYEKVAEMIIEDNQIDYQVELIAIENMIIILTRTI